MNCFDTCCKSTSGMGSCIRKKWREDPAHFSSSFHPRECTLCVRAEEEFRKSQRITGYHSQVGVKLSFQRIYTITCSAVWVCVWPLTQLHLHSNELHSRWREGVRERQNLCMCVGGVGGGVRRMIAQHQHVNEHQLWTCILMANLLLTSDYTLYIPNSVLFKCII